MRVSFKNYFALFVIVSVVIIVGTDFLYAQQSSAPKDANAKPAETSDDDDDDDEEDDTKWSVSAKVSASTRRTKQGVDISKDKPSVGTSLSLSYDPFEKLGLSFSMGSTHIPGENPSYQGAWVNFDFSYNALDWLSVGLNYNRDIYTFDPGNMFGDFVNTYMASIDTDFDWAGLSATLTMMPADKDSGVLPSKFLGLSGYMSFSWGNLTVSPSADISWASYQMKDQRIVEFYKNRNKPIPPGLLEKINAKQAITVEGLNAASASLGLRYKIMTGLKISASAAFLYTPKVDYVSVRSSSANFSLGIQYTFSF